MHPVGRPVANRDEFNSLYGLPEWIGPEDASIVLYAVGETAHQKTVEARIPIFGDHIEDRSRDGFTVYDRLPPAHSVAPA